MEDFWKFLMENKVWWITPTVIVFVGLIVLVWATEGSSIAPFIYSLF